MNAATDPALNILTESHRAENASVQTVASADNSADEDLDDSQQRRRSKSPQPSQILSSEGNPSHHRETIIPSASSANEDANLLQLQAALRENVSLKDKVNKLKDLLTKSSKATRDIKAELHTHKTALDKAYEDIERLNSRVHLLSKRHTHLDWMADFEKNVERALWTVQNQSQTGGEDPSSFSSPSLTTAVDSLYASELEEEEGLGDGHEDRRFHDPSSTMHPYSNLETIHTHTSLLERITILEAEKQVLLDQKNHGKCGVIVIDR